MAGVHLNNTTEFRPAVLSPVAISSAGTCSESWLDDHPQAFPRTLNALMTPFTTVKVVSHTNVVAVGGNPLP